MIFLGQPNQYVRISNKQLLRAGMHGFYFDENGKYTTEIKVLCNVLKQHFKTEENSVTDDKPAEEIYKCKYCDFETGNKGLLMAHYRAHKKEGK